MISEFTRLTDAQLRSRYQMHRNDLAWLKALNEELKRRNSDAAYDLQVEVVENISRLSRLMVTPIEKSLRQLLQGRNLGRPDGRPLHRYNLTDEEYAAFGALLRKRDSIVRMEAWAEDAAQLFVLYAAEWFRREAVSLFRRWDDVAPGILAGITDNDKRALTLKGLQYWRRPLLRGSDDTREFLLSLAIEGGIPANVVLEDTSATLGHYLRMVLMAGLNDSAPEHIRQVAAEAIESLPVTYRNDDFVAQCADLCQQLVHWRNLAHGAPMGIDPVGYLDSTHPDWRASLPIYVPAGHDSGLSRLLNGLIKDRLTGPQTSGVYARRKLILSDGIWRQALEIVADGDISRHRFPAPAGEARVGFVPSGRLADFVAGDFAVAYPPDADQSTWRIRPRLKLSDPIAGFEFHRPVTVNRVSVGTSMPWLWPGGEAVKSDLLVFEAEAGAKTETEQSLILKAQGSYSSRTDILYVWAPLGWQAEGTAIEEIATVNLHRPGRLYRLGAVAYFRSTDSSDGRFRVEPDQTGREDRLIFGRPADGFEAADAQISVFHTPFQVQIETQGRKRSIAPDELLWRRPNEKWQRFWTPLKAEGVIELSWRDARADIQIEKHRLCLLPPAAKIDARLQNPAQAIIDMHALEGWRLEADDLTERFDLTALSPSQFQVIFKGRPLFTLPLRLQPPQGAGLDLNLRVTARDAIIIGADNFSLSVGSELDLAALRGALVLSQGPERLQITLRNHPRGDAFTLGFCGEYPLGGLRNVIEEMLALTGDQDAQAELTFIGDTRPPVRVKRYRQPRPATAEPLRFEAMQGVPVARMVCQPKHEYALIETEDGYCLPAVCAGPVLAYLRDGPDILSRPVHMTGSHPLPPAVSDLRKALAEPDFDARQQHLRQCLRGFASPDAHYDDLEYFVTHIVTLRGVPASAFDALKCLGSVPEALARVLIQARDSVGSEAVWQLQNELPFLWLGLPADVWKTAFHAAAGRLLDDMATLEITLRLKLVRDAMREVADRLVERDPALKPLLAHASIPFSDMPAVADLKLLAGQYVCRMADRPDVADLRLPALPRALAAAKLNIPPLLTQFSLEDWGGLCAPAVLAASALGRLTITPDLALSLRRVMREAPDYVSQAYAAFFDYYRDHP